MLWSQKEVPWIKILCISHKLPYIPFQILVVTTLSSNNHKGARGRYTTVDREVKASNAATPTIHKAVSIFSV
jgi:hypothetical protein